MADVTPQELDRKLQAKINDMILAGKEIKEALDLTRPIDQYILIRMAYYKKAVPLMKKLGVDHLTENSFNNLLIEMYQELKAQNRIILYP